ncbi:hypothetical protein AAE478_001528 [Parahypoxylon ruwenzoriense]
MGSPIRRVAVIGAGPAGAIATDALVKEQAFDDIRVFERHAVAGGTWYVCLGMDFAVELRLAYGCNDMLPVYSSELVAGIPSLRDLIENKADRPISLPRQFPCETSREDGNSHRNRFSDTGVHETLHSNLPPSTMCFTHEPLPDTLSERTLQLYGPGAPFRHREVVRDWVEQIFIRGDHEKLISFNTTVERAEKRGDSWTLTLRKEILDEEKDYWWQEDFDAVIVATGHYNIPYIPNIPGLAEYNEKFPGSIIHSKNYRGTDIFEGKKVIVVGGSVSAFDAIHEIRTVSKRPVISSIRQPLAEFGWSPFLHPHIQLRSAISRLDLDTKTIEFVDGSEVHDVDIVYFATGYDFSFPFLSCVEIKSRRITGLYQHVFSRHDPTLAFIGMITGGLTFRVFEWQAVAAARVFAGRSTLPSEEAMEKWERARLVETGDGLPFFNIGPDYEGYFEALRTLAGDPTPGTTGRVLPRYDKQWEQELMKVVEARKKWWEKERRMDEEP